MIKLFLFKRKEGTTVTQEAETGREALSHKTGRTLGCAILSWKSPQTVRASIQTYLDAGLFRLFDDAVLCFQEIDEEDRLLARDLGLRCTGTEKNSGIQGGFRMACNSLRTDYIIVLENDCPMVVDPAEARRQLLRSIELIEAGKADVVRLRSRFDPGMKWRGAAIYSWFYPVTQPDPRWNQTETLDPSPRWIKKIRRTLRPFKARKWSGRSVYIEQHPDQLFPDRIQREDEVFLVDSSVMPWTNQSSLVTRSFLERLLDYADAHPRSRTVHGFQDLEKPLNCRFWRKAHFRIAIMPGIFTHRRLDGPRTDIF